MPLKCKHSLVLLQGDRLLPRPEGKNHGLLFLNIFMYLAWLSLRTSHTAGVPPAAVSLSMLPCQLVIIIPRRGYGGRNEFAPVRCPFGYAVNSCRRFMRGCYLGFRARIYKPRLRLNYRFQNVGYGAVDAKPISKIKRSRAHSAASKN